MGFAAANFAETRRKSSPMQCHRACHRHHSSLATFAINVANAANAQPLNTEQEISVTPLPGPAVACCLREEHSSTESDSRIRTRSRQDAAVDSPPDAESADCIGNHSKDNICPVHPRQYLYHSAYSP